MEPPLLSLAKKMIPLGGMSKSSRAPIGGGSGNSRPEPRRALMNFVGEIVYLVCLRTAVVEDLLPQCGIPDPISNLGLV